jgi:hypothetical protein
LTVVEKKSSVQMIQRKLLFAGRDGTGEFILARIAESAEPFKIGNQLYKSAFFRQILAMNLKKFLPLLPVLLLAGCSTTATFTRMTATEKPRNADNLYPVEVAFNSQQQSIRWDSVHAFVIVRGQSFPLQPVPIVKNRWEGFITVPPTANTVTYRFKFDYLYNSFGGDPQPDSAWSSSYSMKILDQ